MFVVCAAHRRRLSSTSLLAVEPYGTVRAASTVVIVAVTTTVGYGVATSIADASFSLHIEAIDV